MVVKAGNKPAEGAVAVGPVALETLLVIIHNAPEEPA